ncbi:MAG: glycosyl hydrolase-related protein [Clostridiales bacterium]|nr:glycosyl hydrolase-related protein [Clostridiales bacterium]
MEKRIYTCATAHLDTVWNWDFEFTISTCIYNTLVKNFKLFEQYPEYKFNFEGSYRYELMEEYYPQLFEELKAYVASGQWNVTGSAYENGDVNVPSPEALFRNILYGNGYFEKTFGKRSKEIFLPDCFGFGWALPSIISHANLLGFTTQKLTWGSAYGVPFDVGRWQGVNGQECYACTNPDAYVKDFKEVRDGKYFQKKLKENEAQSGIPWTFGFHGVGDQGGAPKEPSVQAVVHDLRQNASQEVKVLSAPADQIYRDLAALPADLRGKLPVWKNELLMTNHAVGGYTSRAIGKRWNRRGEELADVAERSAVIAAWLGGMEYPQAELERAWKRLIAHQFHDDIPGTSLQRVYQRSWNDYVLSLNQLEHAIAHHGSVLSQAMDTAWCEGQPVLVFNSMEFPRRELVKAQLKDCAGSDIRVLDSNGRETQAQILQQDGGDAVIAFQAAVPALGCAVYDVRQEANGIRSSAVTASETSLENQKYKVTLNANGDIAGIYDKELGKELLEKPIVHEIHKYKGSYVWPAWELKYKEVMAKPKGYPTKKSVTVLDQGPAVASVKVVQSYGDSLFTTVISLEDGGQAVRVENEIEWFGLMSLLKTRFALTASSPEASYDLGLGAIKRGNATKKLYEVPAQRWADISTREYGVSILSDCKYGWDKPADNTLRLTVAHTPRKNFMSTSAQGLMEIGLNRYGYAIYSHGPDAQQAVQKEARKFSQCMPAFLCGKAQGALGSEAAFASLSHENVILRAVKKAEDSDEIVVRFNESANKAAQHVEFSLCGGIAAAREIYASEEALGEATVQDGKLIFDLEPYAVKSFALTLDSAETQAAQPEQAPVELEGNTVLFTPNNPQARPVIKDYKSLTLPKELNPGAIRHQGITFRRDGEQAVVCRGQNLALPKGYRTLHLLAASKSGDKSAMLQLGGREVPVSIPSMTEAVGAWDLISAGVSAYVKDCSLAYEFTHAHNENGGDVIARQMYFFHIPVELNGADSVTLPNDSDLILLAASVSNSAAVQLGAPLYDRVRPDWKVDPSRFTGKNVKLYNSHSAFYNNREKVELTTRDDGYQLK